VAATAPDDGGGAQVGFRYGRRARLTAGVLGAVLASVVLAACGGGSHSGSTPDTTSSSSPSASPSVSTPQVDANGFPLPERPDCAAAAGGEFVRATTSEGNGVGILLIGTGTGGVVLGPQDNGDICSWLPYAEELATTYRVALFDWKEPRPEVPLLAVAALRKAGARRVVLGGASYGGALALSKAHEVTPRLAGVLSFGGELTLPGFDGRSGIRKWQGPLLQVGSVHDDFFDARNAQQLRALHRGPETVLMLPGDTHGIDMLHGAHAERVKAAVDRYLARVLG
jgi:hypothetical protein